MEQLVTRRDQRDISAASKRHLCFPRHVDAAEATVSGNNFPCRTSRIYDLSSWDGCANSASSRESLPGWQGVWLCGRKLFETKSHCLGGFHAPDIDCRPMESIQLSPPRDCPSTGYDIPYFREIKLLNVAQLQFEK
jgi:hypothetical protein